MKKYLFLTMILGAASTSTLLAQNSNTAANEPQAAVTAPVKPQSMDFAAMLKDAKAKQAPAMVEKTGLTLAQAERVIELNFEMRQAAVGLKDLTQEERSKKLAELKADKEKKMSELLTADQIVAVKSFYEEMGKNMQKGN